MHNEPVGSDKRSWKRGWKGPGGKEKGRKGGKKPCSLPALVSGIGQRSTMLLRLPDALHFSAPSKGACNTQHLKHSGTEGVYKCDFFFFLAMPSAIFSLQEFRLDSAWHRQELPARVPSCSSNQAVQRCKYLQPLTWPGDSWGVLPWEVLFLRLLPGTWLQGRA